MKRVSGASWAAFLLLIAVCALPLAAADRISFVPWKVLDAGSEAGDSMFVLYWVPASPDEMRRSDLVTSRVLAVYSAKCVAMRVVRIDDSERLAALKVDALPAVVLMAGSSEVERVGGDGAAIRTVDVEALVRGGFDTRQAAMRSALDRGFALARRGEGDRAAELFAQVAECRCAFPRLAKQAQRALTRLR